MDIAECGAGRVIDSLSAAVCPTHAWHVLSVLRLPLRKKAKTTAVVVQKPVSERKTVLCTHPGCDKAFTSVGRRAHCLQRERPVRFEGSRGLRAEPWS
jgi:hypothetical protein